MKTEKLLRAIANSAAVLFREDDFGKAVRKTLRNLEVNPSVCVAVMTTR